MVTAFPKELGSREGVGEKERGGWGSWGSKFLKVGRRPLRGLVLWTLGAARRLPWLGEEKGWLPLPAFRPPACTTVWGLLACDGKAEGHRVLERGGGRGCPAFISVKAARGYQVPWKMPSPLLGVPSTGPGGWGRLSWLKLAVCQAGPADWGGLGSLQCEVQASR